jgi:broad specificity phosphatase PhoE
VYLITHPDVGIDPAVPVPMWRLSPRGRARMQKLLDQPWVAHVRSVYCSEEQKAIDGAAILAQYLSVGYETVVGLGEVDRSSTGYLPREEHEAAAKALFAYPDRSVQGWETATAAQRRIVRAVDGILSTDQRDGDVAIVSHGAVGTFYLCHLTGTEISQADKPPGAGGGCYYCFAAASRSLVHGWKLIDG